MTYISAPPDYPDRAEPDTFAARAALFLSYFATLYSDMNDFSDWANDLEEAVAYAQVDAEAAALVAQQFANYMGDWVAESASSSSYAFGQTVRHNNRFWIRNVYGAVTPSEEPGLVATTEWVALVPTLGQLARTFGGIAISNMLGIDANFPRWENTYDWRNETNGYNPDFTFVRATTATTVNRLGNLEAVASGELRHWYDPATLKYRGILIEAARTNLLTYSSDFRNTAEASETRPWIHTRAQVTQNAFVSPDGTVNACKFAADGTTGYSTNRTRQTIATAISDNTKCCISALVYAEERSDISLWATKKDGASAIISFDLSDGSQKSSTMDDGGIFYWGKDYYGGTGWYFIWGMVNVLTGATTPVGHIVLDGISITAGHGIGVYEALFEVGSFPSISRIPTTTATVARNADLLTLTGDDLAVAHTPQDSGDQGTIYIEAYVPIWSATALHRLWSFGGDGLRLFLSGAETQVSLTSTTGSTAISKTGLEAVGGRDLRIAVGFETDNTAMSVNGSSVAEDISCTPIPTTTWTIGGYSSSYLGGFVSVIAESPKRISNAELMALSS